MLIVASVIALILVWLSLSCAKKDDKTVAKKGPPKWLQIKYFIDDHCDVGLTHTVHYPIGQCVSNRKGSYNLLKLTVAKDGQVTYRWAHFTDVKCTKLLTNIGNEFVMTMRESECNQIWFKTSAGEQLWMREYLFYTKEPPSFPHSGQRYSYFQDDKCTSLVKDQVMNIDNCWKSPNNSAMPPGYRFVCSESSLGYMIPYEDRQCKKLDLKAAKPPPDAPDAVDPFHVGGPEYQAQPGDEVSETEGGGEDVDATDTETDASTDTDADTGIEADTVVEETPEADESADGRKLQSISRKLLEPTTRCFPVKQRRPADTLHYVIESCYLGPEKSVIWPQSGKNEPLTGGDASGIADGTPDASVDWLWSIDVYSQIIDPTSKPVKVAAKPKLRKVAPSIAPTDLPPVSEDEGEDVSTDTDTDTDTGTDTHPDSEEVGADTADSPTDNTDGDTTNEETNEDADTEDIGISDNTSNEGDSSSNEGDNTDNNGDAEVEPVIPKKKKKASKAPTFSPTSPTVAPTLSLEQIFKNNEALRLKAQQMSESTFVIKFIFYGILAAALLYSGYNYFLNEYMKASCGGHRDEDLEHERKRLLKDRAKDEAHYYKNKLSTNQTEAKMASSGQYNIRKLFNAIKTRGRSSGL